MRQSWILLVALFGFIAIIGIAFWQQRQKAQRKISTKNDCKPLANTNKVRALPEYKAALKKYHLLLMAAGLLFIVVFSSVAIIAARPVSVTVSKPEYDNRDIMLCLDVSGSMNEYVKELVEYFADLLDDFKGQRVGLTLFDSVYLTVAPLSDDYDLLADLLKDFKDDPFAYSYALYSSKVDGTSAIGRGVVGCVNGFDKLEEQERSRSIILATDNEDAAGRVVTLTQAANYAKRYNIAIYGLSTGEYRSQEQINNPTSTYGADYLEEFREATLNTGGAYYAFSSWSNNNNVVVSEIVDQILEQEAARYEGAETLVRNDSPTIPIIIATISAILFFIVIWRLSL
ncbi:VWA domain-containing protein [Candidatus Saccharibacteria bacterium]|nr:VWA domain-containing protein [Candidatus Saccharibacteria bacterium]